jgi:hypothetical protein
MSILWQKKNQHPVVSDRDFKRFLRFPPARPFPPALAENAAWARDWFAAHAQPWFCAIRADATVQTLAANRFPTAEALAVVACSAGPEPEAEAAARWAAEEPDRYFFMECLAAATVEALLAEARRRLGAEKHLCPGYPGWPIVENANLLGALNNAGAMLGPITMLSSGMLTPKKSQLAVCPLRTVPPLAS